MICPLHNTFEITNSLRLSHPKRNFLQNQKLFANFLCCACATFCHCRNGDRTWSEEVVGEYFAMGEWRKQWSVRTCWWTISIMEHSQENFCTGALVQETTMHLPSPVRNWHWTGSVLQWIENSQKIYIEYKYNFIFDVLVSVQNWPSDDACMRFVATVSMAASLPLPRQPFFKNCRYDLITL